VNRRQALKPLLLLPAVAISCEELQPTTSQALVPFKLNAEGVGFARDRNGDVHPIHNPLLVHQVGDIRLDGRKREYVQEFNTEKGWIRQGLDKDDFSKSGLHEVVSYGKVTVEWRS